MSLAFLSDMAPVANTSKPRRMGTRTMSTLLISGVPPVSSTCLMSSRTAFEPMSMAA